MRGDGPDWSETLHALWRSVGTITARDELGALVLPPLLTLPGVVAVWGLRHVAGGGYSVSLAADESTPAPTGDLPPYRRLSDAERDAAGRLADDFAAGGPRIMPADGLLRDRGADRVALAAFEVAGEPAGTMMAAVDADADAERVADCLQQVIDVTREAVRRLRARHAEEEQQTRDALLAEASLQMDAVLDMAQTMRRVARMTVPAIAEGCLVYLREDDKPVRRSAVHVDMRRLDGLLADGEQATRLAAMAERAIRTGAAERVRDGERTVHAQPLRARGRAIGVLLFLFDRDGGRLPDPGFLHDLALRAALAIDNGEQYEQRRQEVLTLQQHLLPRRLPTVPGFEIAASYTVGDRVMEVGGDFYDAVVRADGVVAAVIGDVCGRGTEAAALTGMSRHTLGALLQEGVSPARTLARLNSGLRRDGSWRFVTAGVALLKHTGGGATVQWSSAGHPAPVVLRRASGSTQGRGGGVPLGILDSPAIARSRITLRTGDTLLMFTDGLTESRDAAGQMFEDDALRRTLDRLRDAPVQTLVDDLASAASAFGVTGADDIAVLAIRAGETS